MNFIPIEYKLPLDPATQRSLNKFITEYNRYLHVLEEYYWVHSDRQKADSEYLESEYLESDFPESELLNGIECAHCADIARAFIEKQNAEIWQDIIAVRKAYLKNRKDMALKYAIEVQANLNNEPVPSYQLPARVHMSNFIFFYGDNYVRLFTQKKDIKLHFVLNPAFMDEWAKGFRPHWIEFFPRKMRVFFEDAPIEDFL